jgi:hypothetical protein
MAQAERTSRCLKIRGESDWKKSNKQERLQESVIQCCCLFKVFGLKMKDPASRLQSPHRCGAAISPSACDTPS